MSADPPDFVGRALAGPQGAAMVKAAMEKTWLGALRRRLRCVSVSSLR